MSLFGEYIKERLNKDIIEDEKGFDKMFTTVVPSTNNATVSLKACISYGFKLHSCEQNLIILVKEI